MHKAIMLMPKEIDEKFLYCNHVKFFYHEIVLRLVKSSPFVLNTESIFFILFGNCIAGIGV